MANHRIPTAILAAFLLAGCGTSTVFELVPEEVISRDMAPPGAPPGTCWGRDATPAVIETVTEQVMLDEEGTDPVYETQTSQQIVTPREDTWFERPCDDMMTPEFNASLQRALEARGHYRGPITGRMDGRTRAAIRAYQKPQGLDSGMLSLAAARQMGLLQVDLNDAGISVPEVPGVAVATLDESRPEPVSLAPVAESASAQAARLEQEQAAERLAAIERAEQAEREAARQAAIRAEEEARAAEAARIAEAEAAEARRLADAKAAEEARLAAEREAAAAAEREKNKRAKELAQALEEERNRTGGTVFDPLPISSESY